MHTISDETTKDPGEKETYVVLARTTQTTVTRSSERPIVHNVTAYLVASLVAVCLVRPEFQGRNKLSTLMKISFFHYVHFIHPGIPSLTPSQEDGGDHHGSMFLGTKSHIS
ncbi:unnamed protein product [Cuscuta epithymum]|uniref:Uncharacterized protein n=1 Tax=Cuscuta epithymum TaxID=186058 RepID=A0AAV0D9U5_9ASTE|nr:unnamed protein product [Cuscuta epithymum]